MESGCTVNGRNFSPTKGTKGHEDCFENLALCFFGSFVGGLQLFKGEEGGEVEALQPDFVAGEAGVGEAGFVGVDGFGDEDVFDGGAFLGDLEVGVPLGAFEVVVQGGEVGLDLGVVEEDFFGEDEDAAGDEPFLDAGEQGESLFFGDELEGEVEDDDGGVFDGRFLDVLAVEVYAVSFLDGGDVGAAAFEHGGGVVDTVEGDVRGGELGAHGGDAGAEGAAEVVDAGAGFGVVLGDDAE